MHVCVQLWLISSSNPLISPSAETERVTWINNWIYEALLHKLTWKWQSFSCTSIFSQTMVGVVVPVDCVVCTARLCDTAVQLWKGCGSRRQTTVLTAPTTWLHTNVLVWRISLSLPPNQLLSLFSTSRQLSPSSSQLFSYVSLFLSSLPSFFQPSCSSHCVAVIWHWAAAGTTHPPPLQWNIGIQPHGT